MIREYCDNCGIELCNSYWSNPKAKTIKKITINLDGREISMLLCLGCYTDIVDDVYKFFNWYFKKEEDERVKLDIR
jgi:hypothetical protein